MSSALTITLAFLALTMLGTLVRVVRGPQRADRLIGVALASTTGIGFLLVAAVRFDVPALRDAALVIGALAVVVVASSVRAGRVNAPAQPRATAQDRDGLDGRDVDDGDLDEVGRRCDG